MQQPLLSKIAYHHDRLYTHFQKILSTDENLTRAITSSNKKQHTYSWYKYKEGFSANLIKKYLADISPKNVLDPFAGSGTTLFCARETGVNSVGIELLPICWEILETKNIILNQSNEPDFTLIKNWVKKKPWKKSQNQKDFNEINITKHAYPSKTSQRIKQYLGCLSQEKPPIQKILFFALLCILENISYTSKDGQFLRWDKRSGKNKTYTKKHIANFDDAICRKLNEIIQYAQQDIFRQYCSHNPGTISLLKGSSLNILPAIKQNTFNAIITSPPYCNRYDYTRSYALELALLGINDKRLKELRQSMISCTVENKEKNLLSLNPLWAKPIEIIKDNSLLQSILNFLEWKKSSKSINNNNIPRMIKNYFYEMGCIIYESHRILKTPGYLIMFNDNVKYSGISIPVDLILSSIAENIGFTIKIITVLKTHKGNSSQQMSEHGREPLRKCIYFWIKNKT